MSDESCPNCEALLHGPYCSDCGQRKPQPDDYSTLGFLVDAATEIFSVDGKTWRTIRTLLLHPGRLTLDHFQGRRIQYIKPIQLFLIVNVLFFLIAVQGGILDFTLNEYLASGPPSTELVRELVRKKIAETGTTPEEYAARFDRQEEILRKGLIFLMVPFLAAILWILNFRQRRYFAQHLVSSIHFYSFFWLFGTIMAFPVAFLGQVILGLRADDAIIPFLKIATLIYVYLMLRTIDGQSRVVTLVKTALCTAAIFQLVAAYRVLLFFGAYLLT